MARQTTENIESKTRVYAGFEVFDFFFVIGYFAISYALSDLVHDRLKLPFMIFSFLMAVFLTARSTFNKKRRNYESLYFLITKDVAVYGPFAAGEGRDVWKKEG